MAGPEEEMKEMAVRWTEREYREYLAKSGKLARKKQKRVKPKKTRESKVEPVADGVKLTIPRVHPSLNKWTRWHFGKVHEEKVSWEDEIILLLHKYRHLHLTQARVMITYYMPGCPDHDNRTPKFIMDGLVKSGILADDSIEVVTPQWEIVKATAGEQRTEILIEWEGGGDHGEISRPD